MNSSVNIPRARRIRFDAENLWVELTDGRQIGVPLAYFPRLSNAKPAQRDRYIISGGGTGLHWEEIDEDLSVQGLLMGALRVQPSAKAAKLHTLRANPTTHTIARTGRTRKIRIGGG